MTDYISDICFVWTHDHRYYAVYAGGHLLLEGTEPIEAPMLLDALGFDVRTCAIDNKYAQDMPTRLPAEAGNGFPAAKDEIKYHMLEVREFKPAFLGAPTENEIREGMRIANTENCIVRLGYTLKFHGKQALDITPGMTYEQCKRNLDIAYKSTIVEGVD